MNRIGKHLLASLLVLTMLLGSFQPANAIFDKTRFVADLGIAYFSFHHWVSKPAKEGAFASGAPHRTAAIVKAGGALLLAVNRVKKANWIAHHTKDPLLSKLATKLDALQASFATMGSKFKGGNMAPTDLGSLNSVFSSFDSAAKGGGLAIQDKAG
jgi:hypothetical protein